MIATLVSLVLAQSPGVAGALANCDDQVLRPECFVTAEPATWDAAFRAMLTSDEAMPKGPGPFDPYGWPANSGNDNFWKRSTKVQLDAREYVFDCTASPSAPSGFVGIELPRPTQIEGAGGHAIIGHMSTRLSFPRGCIGIWAPGFVTNRPIQCVDDSDCPQDANPPQSCATNVDNCGQPGEISCICTPVRGEYNGDIDRDAQGVMRGRHIGAGASISGLQLEFRSADTVGTATAAGHGILIGGPIFMERLLIRGASGDGVRIQPIPGGGPNLGYANSIQIENVGQIGWNVPLENNSNSNQWQINQLSIINATGSAIVDHSKLGNGYFMPHVNSANGLAYDFGQAATGDQLAVGAYQENALGQALSDGRYATFIGGNVRIDTTQPSAIHLSASGWRGTPVFNNITQGTRTVIDGVGTSYLELFNPSNQRIRWYFEGSEIRLGTGTAGDPALRLDPTVPGSPAHLPTYEVGRLTKIRVGSGRDVDRPSLPDANWPAGSRFHNTEATTVGDVATWCSTGAAWLPCSVVQAGG